MDENEIIDEIDREFGAKGESHGDGQIWVKIKKDDIASLSLHLKGMGFEHLSAISVTDWIEKSKFELAYFIWSYDDKIMLAIKTDIEREKPSITSVVSIWSESAQIHERELHEMFGIEFKGNPDLSELFLEDWKGPAPFRKDFSWRKYVKEKYYINGKKKEKSYLEAAE